jgi:hypothetical protein
MPAALALVAAISGCPVSNPTPAAPPANAVQTEAPSTAQPPAPPLTLASPSIDSDLDAEDNAAIENLLDSDDMEAYMPSDLIHDGGVILFRTMATRKETAARVLPGTNVAVTAEADVALAEPPQDWRRTEGRRGARQLVLRKEGGNGEQPGLLSKRARVVVKYGVAGQLLFNTNGRRVAKPFSQQFSRTFKFKLADARWQLDELTPLQHESQGGRSGIDLDHVALYAAGEDKPRSEVVKEERFISPDEVPTFAPGESVRLEVKATQKKDAPVFVYAYMVGGTDRSRVLLKDDGTLGDEKAGDGIHTATFAVPTTPGLRHFGVDVINAAAFQPAGLVRSNGLGISFRVQSR